MPIKHGITKFLQSLDDLVLVNKDQALQIIGRVMAETVETRAKKLCPVDTGTLKGSIRTDTHAVGDKYAAIVGSPVKYARYVEYGTAHQRPQPYLRPALDEEKENAIKMIRQDIMEAIGK